MQDIHDPVALLSGLALFADLSRPQLEAAAHMFEEQWFSEDERILREGFSGGGFYIILDGDVAFRRGGVESGRFGRGDFFGEISVLLGDAPISDVVALTPLRCLVLPGPELQEFLESNPKVMFRMLQAEAGRLRASVEQ